MCDYSIHSVDTRPAKKSDTLVLSTFKNSLTRGFTEVGEPDVAVCLMPGSELKIDDPLKIDRRGLGWLLQHHGILAPRTLAAGVATFVQINMHRQDAHHDALKIGDQIVSLQRITVGQQVRVLQLPVGRDKVPSVNEQMREHDIVDA